MSCYNKGGAKEMCKKCGVMVTDVGRHRKRNRCLAQHFHPSPKHNEMFRFGGR